MWSVSERHVLQGLADLKYVKHITRLSYLSHPAVTAMHSLSHWQLMTTPWCPVRVEMGYRTVVKYPPPSQTSTPPPPPPSAGESSPDDPPIRPPRLGSEGDACNQYENLEWGNYELLG